jgi:hypothetical protein
MTIRRFEVVDSEYTRQEANIIGLKEEISETSNFTQSELSHIQDQIGLNNSELFFNRLLDTFEDINSPRRYNLLKGLVTLAEICNILNLSANFPVQSCTCQNCLDDRQNRINQS